MRTTGDGTVDVIVVGAGPAGLAVSAELTRRGSRPLVLERGDAVGQRWRERYDRLHLHTVRGYSGLPGTPLPRDLGRFVAAEAFARYLQDYARRHAIDVRLRTGVAGVESRSTREGARWAVHLDSGEHLTARTLVIATGRAAQPLTPAWPGSEEFAGDVLHSSGYRNPAAFSGRRMLVVGAGNSGGEIAADLSEAGASSVDLSVRTPPHIVRREIGPFWSSQQSGILLERLPTHVLDVVARVQDRLTMPDLTGSGLPRPRVGLATRIRRDGVVPLQDVGLVSALRSGAVRVRPELVALHPGGARFRDGTAGCYDTIIAATGFTPSLSALVRDAALLDARGLPCTSGGRPAAPGIYFIGYSITLSGALHDISTEARLAARTIARDQHQPRTPR
jgi:putative flavoprotein involved in K+ transport